ncbi:LysR family transcriptional regulator [Eremococcus coleocola]|uniref:LysR substrate binding domain protein n=1 Tax=Eremococcus coleocola ACS-139-V-Col8 TaxID=908337 RepID=E4KRB5_9LACT|nr:LysR family transcriptional regulator [Eremococcus coleocola]EFR30515.1 LysR substrate binding domain protein [Eremococcus coleocola ACS-139-V-Col8]
MKFDITQMEYFVNIVECGFNLSLASKKIHISQSALSQFITNFEKEQQVDLFERKNGRLDSLTAIGQVIYEASQEIVREYQLLREKIEIEAGKHQGTIRVGLPSLILRFYFASFFTQIMLENPDIYIEVVEDGSIGLRKKLIDKELDLAVLIEPTNLDPNKFEQQIIQVDQMAAFMDIHHPLSEKVSIDWKDLKQYPISTFSKSFTTYDLVQERLEKEKLSGNILMFSSSWDYLVECTQQTDLITILPAPIKRYINKEKNIMRPINNYIPFNFYICRPSLPEHPILKEELYNRIIELFYQPVE